MGSTRLPSHFILFPSPNLFLIQEQATERSHKKQGLASVTRLVVPWQGTALEGLIRSFCKINCSQVFCWAHTK